jgi:hypothetical protein
MEEEEEGKLIASKDKDTISIKIEKFNADFAPGFGKLEIKYLLGERTMNIIKKYPNEKFNFYITIANKEGKIIYNKKEEPKEKGEFKWDGINYEKDDTIKIDNGPFNIALTLIGGEEKGWFENWKTFKDKLYTTFYKDSVFQIATSVDTTFNINPVRIEWITNKDMQKYVSSYEYYVKLRDLYMAYEGVKKAGNPFEYLKNNTKEIEFLGKKVRVHNEFAIILQKVEETLKTEGVYNELKSKYRYSCQTLCMREINDPKGKDKLSEHAFGLAIDILPKKNPQIHENSALVRYFIKKSTGFDIGEKKTVEQIKNAHIKFLEIYKNTNISKIVEKYKEIYSYNKDTGIIKIENLQDYNNKLTTLQQLIKNPLLKISKNDSINKENLFKPIKIELENNIAKINMLNKILENYANTIIFNETSKTELEYLKETCVQIKNQITSIIHKIDNKDTIDIRDLNFNDFILFDNNRIKTLLKEINDFQIEIENIKKSNSKKYIYTNLYEFADELEREIKNIGFNNILFSDGFCDIEMELIEAFLNVDPRIQWGGTFTEKIDAMHFGFKTQHVKDIIK